MTVVIITHEMSIVEKICDRVAIIDKGNLAEIGNVVDVFSSPKSDAAKRLVFRTGNSLGENEFDIPETDTKLIRIVFDGLTAHKPFISDLVEDTGRKVNILSANTKSVGGIGYGQMIVELPENKEDQKIVLDYFKKSGLSISEISTDEVSDVA